MTLMKTLNFMKTLFLLVAIVGLSSCGDKYYSDDYLRNSNAKLCGKTWVNDSEKNDVDEWVRHTLKFDDNGRLAETYAYYHVNESQPYRTETNNLTWSWIDDTMEGIVFDYGVNGVTYFDNVWVREHNMSGKLNGKVVVFVDSKIGRNERLLEDFTDTDARCRVRVLRGRSGRD